MNVALPTTIRIAELCAGAGAMGLGIKRVLPQARTVVYVEIEAYAAATLVARMQEGRLDEAPVWSDLRTFDARPWRGAVDLVCGGYPCQPFSQAGKRLGADDLRHLWPHVARILRECRPALAFFENVPGHVSLGLRDVRCDLEEMGYRVEAVLVRAEEVGAPHRRERLFVLAYAEGIGKRKPNDTPSTFCGGANGGNTAREGAGCDGVSMEHANHIGQTRDTQARRETVGRSELPGGSVDDPRLEGRSLRGVGGTNERTAWPPGPDDADGWREYLERCPGTEPALCRGDARLAHRLDRLRLLGNLNPPQQYEYALRILLNRIGGA